MQCLPTGAGGPQACVGLDVVSLHVVIGGPRRNGAYAARPPTLYPSHDDYIAAEEHRIHESP
jgi:hypothetical protein